MSLALDDHALEDLDTTAGALDDLEVHLHPVARRKRGNAAQLRTLDGFDDAAHDGEEGGAPWRPGRSRRGVPASAECHGSGRPSQPASPRRGFRSRSPAADPPPVPDYAPAASRRSADDARRAGPP